MRIHILAVLSALAVASALPAAAATSWSCRNPIEVGCSAKTCEVAADFTAMDISLAENGRVSVCAYSGCWEGKAVVTHRAGFVQFVASRLVFSSGGSASAMTASIDTRDRIGVIKIGGYAQPIICKQT